MRTGQPAYVPVLLCALAAAVGAQDSGTFLIRNADVYTGSGPVLAGHSILVEQGRITKMGSDLDTPPQVPVIDAAGLRVYPGLIDSGTALGLSEIPTVPMSVDTGELGELMPQLRVRSAINPDSSHFPVVRVNGITTAVVFPRIDLASGRGDDQTIAGQAAMIYTDGWREEDLVIQGSAALEILFPGLHVADPNAPPVAGALPTFTEASQVYQDRIARLDDFFAAARRYRDAKLAQVPGLIPDLKLEAMLPVLDRSVPVAIAAQRARAVRDAVAFAVRNDLRMILLDPQLTPRELAEAAPLLRDAGIPVVFGRTLSLPMEDDEAYDSRYRLPALAYQAGLEIAFGTFDNQFVRDLPYDAAAAVAFGLPYDAAIRALTSNAARIWGVEGETGSLEPGKWADLVVADGDLLETATQIRHVFIRGRPVNLTNRQTRLYERYLEQ